MTPIAFLLLACSSEPAPTPPQGPFGLVYATSSGVVRADQDGKNVVAVTSNPGDALPVPLLDGSVAFERPPEPSDCTLVRHAALWIAEEHGEREVSPAVESGSPRTTTDGKSLVWASSSGDADSCGQPFLARKRLFVQDGGAPREIAASKKPVTDGDAAWSPDGKKLAFVRDGELYVQDVGRDAPMRLTDSERRATMASPVWSPDGAELVFAVLRDDPKKSEIWRIPSGGGKYERLHDGGAFDLPVAWSWDGSTLLLESTLWAGDTADAAVVALHLPSGSRTVLAPDPAEDRDPTLSPDGRFVAFASNRGGSWDLWRVGLDGNGLTQLTKGAGVEARALWTRPAPDGN